MSIENVLALTKLRRPAIRLEWRWSLSLDPANSFRPPFSRTQYTWNTFDGKVYETTHSVAYTAGTIVNPTKFKWTKKKRRWIKWLSMQQFFICHLPSRRWSDCPVALPQLCSDCTLAHRESYAMRYRVVCNQRRKFDLYSSSLIRWEHWSKATFPTTEPLAETNLLCVANAPYVRQSNRPPSLRLTKSKHLCEIGIGQKKNKQK